MTARSDRDLTPEGIVQKVADASGAKYSAGSAPPPVSAATKPAVASKPAFTPTRSTAGGFNPLASSRTRSSAPRDANVDEDGWGADAPPVTRTQLEKVKPAYTPTRVDINALSSQKQTSSYQAPEPTQREDVVRGGYQPIGKVDIAAIRRQAKESGQVKDDRPEIVKGAYEPIGKVDIAAIRAKAQKPADAPARAPPAEESSDEQPKSLAERSSAFTQSERLTSMPKPKVANKFGGASSFTGTKAPAPGGFTAKTNPTAAPVGIASRTFADQGGKTPAQLWAEKKARERGASGSGDSLPPSASQVQSQPSGDGGWKSGYSGKSWAPVQTTYTGKSAGSSIGQQRTGGPEPAEEEEATTSGVGSIRDRFKEAPPMGAPASFERSAPSPPPLDTATKPNANRGVPIPGLASQATAPDADDIPDEQYQRVPTPPAVPRSPTPPTPARSPSPIRVAAPVSRLAEPEEVTDAHEEQFSPPPAMPIRSLAQAVPSEPEDDEPSGYDPARATALAAAEPEPEQSHAPAAPSSGGIRALVQYDYEKAEDNEVELHEGEYVTNVEMVDEDWWLGVNARGEQGLFPSNYVEVVEGDDDGAAEPAAPAAASAAAHEPPAAPPAPAGASAGPTATALYDYEAAEDNEISFPDGAKIMDLVSPSSCFYVTHYPKGEGRRKNFHADAIYYRNSPMRTGGLEHTRVALVFSQPITSSLTSRSISQVSANLRQVSGLDSDE